MIVMVGVNSRQEGHTLIHSGLRAHAMLIPHKGHKLVPTTMKSIQLNA